MLFSSNTTATFSQGTKYVSCSGYSGSRKTTRFNLSRIKPVRLLNIILPVDKWANARKNSFSMLSSIVPMLDVSMEMNVLFRCQRKVKRSVSLCVLVVTCMINMSIRQRSHICELGGKSHAYLVQYCVTSVPGDSTRAIACLYNRNQWMQCLVKTTGKKCPVSTKFTFCTK